MSESDVKPRTPQEDKKSESTEHPEQPGQAPDRGSGPLRAESSKEEESPDSRLQALETQVAELKADSSSLQEELLRRAAEFENFRKRMFRDKEDAIRYANAGLLSDVLPIIDDFERAIQSAEESKDFAAFHAGVTLIEKQLVSVLERNWGLKRFSAEGEVFDPERHEAIAAEETDKHETSIVMEEYQKGYFLHDRVLRPAKVKVAKPVAPDESGGNNA
jgi:molecular chaperone GrpE